MKDSLCLLVFSYNSYPETVNLINKYKGDFDEIVVIDGSSPEIYDHLCESIGDSASLYHVFPTGTTGTLRNYATRKIDSDFVLVLDTDEDLTEKFRKDLRKLNKHSAYFVGWNDVKLGETTKKLVLYRNGCLKYRGHVFEIPEILGDSEDVSKEYSILHYADFDNYGIRSNRYETYFFYESFLRPLNYSDLFHILKIEHLKMRRKGAFCAYMPFLTWWLIFQIAYIERLIRTPDNKFISKFLLRYSRDRLSYQKKLNKGQRYLFADINYEIYEEGGLSNYLSLADDALIDQLSSSYDWKGEKLTAMKKLIMYRYLNRRMLRSFDAFPYSNKELNDFWMGSTNL